MSAPVNSPQAGIAVYERQPFWGPELQRQLTHRRVLVRECRSVRDLVPAVEDFSKAVAVLVFDASPTECLRWLADEFSASLCRIVVASREYAELESLIREAGAVYVDDEVPRSYFTKVCLRHLRVARGRT